MNLLKNRHLPAILRCITVAGLMVLALDLFDTLIGLDMFELAWPYKLIIGSIVMFIVFSFTGVWDDDNEIHDDRR